MRKEKKFESYIEFTSSSNRAMFILLKEYFQILYKNKELQKKDEIEDLIFIEGFSMTDVTKITEYGTHRIIFSYCGLQILGTFDVYIDGVEKKYIVSFSSIKKSFLDPNYIYQDIISKSIIQSDIKGNYIHLYESLTWEIKPLTKRGFNDIFLPKSNLDEILIYKQIFERQKILMRYLLVGIPGTGKTESTLVLANEMLKAGVTIIKTSVSEELENK